MSEQAGNLSHLPPFVLDCAAEVSSQVLLAQSDAATWQNILVRNILVSLFLAAAKKWLHCSVALILHRQALTTISLRSIGGGGLCPTQRSSTCVHPDWPACSRHSTAVAAPQNTVGSRRLTGTALRTQTALHCLAVLQVSSSPAPLICSCDGEAADEIGGC